MSSKSHKQYDPNNYLNDEAQWRKDENERLAREQEKKEERRQHVE